MNLMKQFYNFFFIILVNVCNKLIVFVFISLLFTRNLNQFLSYLIYKSSLSQLISGAHSPCYYLTSNDSMILKQSKSMKFGMELKNKHTNDWQIIIVRKYFLLFKLIFSKNHEKLLNIY